jgi:hypothetical protein
MEIDPYTQELIKDLVGRTLGPTADYVGNEVKEFVEFRVENVKRIFQEAKRKQKRELNPSEGVHPRVLREVVNTGSFSDDTLWADYFGGVLASSSSENSQDDRGIIYTALIGRLSRFDLRLHCALYLAVQEHAVHLAERLSKQNGLDHERRIRIIWDTLQKRFFISTPQLISAMGFSAIKEGMEFDILREAMASLARESLIKDDYHIVPEGGYSSNKDAPTIWRADKPGYVFHISDQGISLFMWALGLGNLNRNDFLHTDISQVIPEGIIILENIEIISEKSQREESIRLTRNAL